MRSQPVKMIVFPLAGNFKKINFYSSYATLLLFFLISCTPGAGTQIMTGRTALMDGNPKAALPKFEAVSQANPNYIYCMNLFCVGIWTYLGRTYHEIADNYKAVESLNKGKGRHSSDKFARIYRGLVKAPVSPLFPVQTELDAGLEALNAWLVGLPGSDPDGQYWDIDGHLRKGIAGTRELLQADRINWDKVEKDIRWLAVNFEEEAQEVLREKQHEGSGDD